MEEMGYGREDRVGRTENKTEPENEKKRGGNDPRSRNIVACGKKKKKKERK